MWICASCDEEQEDGFEACWNCGTSRSGEVDPDFEVEEMPMELRERQRSEIRCLRCDRELDFMGTRYFHEGARLGVLGNLAELFVNKQGFDIYSCSECGHVDFFLAGSR